MTQENAYLSEEVEMLRQQLRRFVESEVAPHGEDWEREGQVPRQIFRQMGGLGFLGIRYPEAYGGAELDTLASVVFAEELGRSSFGGFAAGVLVHTDMASPHLARNGSPEQLQRYMPGIVAGEIITAIAVTEPDAGSDVAAIRTRAVKDGNGWRLNGAKLFITNGDVADLLLVFGKWTEIEDARGAITAIVVEKGAPGLSVGRKEGKMGHRASSTVALAFDGCRVPRANLLGAPGQGLAILLAALNTSRPSIAAHALGIATAAFTDMVAYMNQRAQFGRKIVDFQGNQFLLADLAAELAMCEAWLDHVAALIDAGENDIALEASIAKLRASDLAMRMTTEAVQMHGGYGYCTDLRVERLMRDAKITQIWEGTNQIHRQLIGRSFRAR